MRAFLLRVGELKLKIRHSVLPRNFNRNALCNLVPIDDFKSTIHVFNKRRATFYPVTIIEIMYVAESRHLKGNGIFL